MGKKVAEMTPEDAERRREYMRQYRAAHRDELREYYHDRHERHRDEDLARSRQHYQDNRDKYRSLAKANYAAKKDEYAVRNRAYREANIGRIMLIAARDRTLKQGLPECDLTIEYIESLIPEVCPILGIPLKVGNGRPEPGSPSLDRVVPSLGYVHGNVQVISNKANMMKQDASWAELRRFAVWVLENAPLQFANDY